MALSSAVSNIINREAPSSPSQQGGTGSSGSGYQSVAPGTGITSTQPAGNYNNKADYIPQSVTDAQQKLNYRSIPSQQYANQVQNDLIADYHGYMTDKNYQGKYSATEAMQGYDYLSRANNGAPDLDWNPPKADDQLFTQIVPRWDAARDIQEAAALQYDAPVPTRDDSIMKSVLKNNNLTQTQQEIVNARNIEHGDWNALSLIDKAKALLVPGSNGEGQMLNLPSWAKFISNIFPSVMASGAGAAIGSAIAPGVGTAIGALTVGGLSYLQGVTGIEIPVINELLYGMDILSVWAEQGQGAIGAAAGEAWRRANEDGTVDILELGKTMGEVLHDLPDLFDVSQISYEIGADLGMDNTINFIRNIGAGASDKLFGTDFGQVDTNTVSRANIGLGGLIDVNPETRGYQALTDVYLPLYRAIRDEAVKQGMSEKEAKAFAVENIQGYLTNYMGTTGLANDFAASAVFDPMNLAPYVQAKTADTIGRLTKNDALQTAAKVALEGSSPIVDMFSVPILEQVAEFITGKHTTQGMDTIRRVWAQELQAKPVDTLSGFEKRIAGINSDGVIKGFDHESNPVKKWFGLTEEAKMFRLSEYTANMLGSILFADETTPDMIPELVSQFVGISPIGDDSPLASMRNSGILNTVQTLYGNMSIDDIQHIQKQMNTFRQYNSNRIMFNLVAEKLHMKPEEIFNALDNPEKYNQLRTQIYKNNITWTDPVSGMIFDPSQVIESISVFANEGSSNNRPYYSFETMKAYIMEDLFKKAEASMFNRYPNIQPDKWTNRISKLANSVQSIALLNFSPSYFVNNALNNILTRSVVGVGGVDTQKVKTANERRGLSFTRDGDLYKKAENAVNAKHLDPNNGLTQRLQQTFNDITDNKLLKGFNNIDIEAAETKAAFDIGANRYWESTWKPGLNLPEVPKEWKALGFTDEMATTIYKAAMDSANLTEFKKKIAGDIVLPGAKSTFNDMIAKNYSEAAGKMVENLFSTMPWISDKIDAAMESGDPKAVEATFDEIIRQVTNKIKKENIVQLNTEFENLTTRFAGEGFAAVASAREALFDLYCDIWLNQTKDSEDIFAQRVMKSMTEEEFRPIYEAHMKAMDNDYNMVRKYEVQYTAAMIAGLGLSEDVAKSLLINTMSQFDIESKYIQEEHQLFMKYVTGDSPDFEYYKQAKLEMCQKVLDQKLQAAIQYDQILIDYLRNNLDESYTAMIDDYEKEVKYIQERKADLNTREIKWLTERLNDSDIVHKDYVARVDPGHNIERWRIKNAIQNHFKDVVAPKLQELAGGIEKSSTDKVKLDIAQTLAIELLYREAKKTVDNSSEYLSHFIDKTDPQTVFDPITFQNTTMEGTFIDNAHKNADQKTLDELTRIFDQGDAVPLGTTDVRNRILNDDVISQPISGPVDTDAYIKNLQNELQNIHSDIDNLNTQIDALVQENNLEKNLDELKRLNNEKAGKNIRASQIEKELNEMQKKSANGKNNSKDIKTAIDESSDLTATDYVPFKADFKNASDAKLTQVRCNPFIFGNSYARAGVYHEGNLIAYITDDLPDVIKVGENSFPVIGKDISNPDALWLYIADEPTLITPGRPKDVDYSLNAQTGEHPMRFGSTPTTEQWGTAAWETSLPMREALEHWKSTALDSIYNAAEAGSFMKKLTPEQQKMVYDWINTKLNSAYNYQRFASNRYGSTMVDLSLLNYNDRHGYDSLLTTIMPYQYWLTRSIMNWGARMIDQPKWFSMYARMNKLIERNKKDFLPSRLEGMIGIPLPFMPEGLGSGLYFNPSNIALPFKQFYDADEYFKRNLHTIHQNTLRVIDEYYSEQKPYDGHVITEEEYEQAQLGRGEIYTKVFWDQRNSDETDTGLTGLVGSLINPNVLLTSALKALEGNDKEISYSPMYKLGNTIRSAGRDTIAEKVTNIVGSALQLPEKKWRQMLGVESNDIGTNWVDYWVPKYLADMLYDKKATRNEVVNAIAEGESNPLWQEAYKRYSQSEAYKQVGGGLLNEVAQSLAGNKETSAGQIAGTALASVFGGRTESTGEDDYRRQQALYQQYKSDPSAKQEFIEHYPDFKVGAYASVDTPEERLHRILVDNCNEAYYALPESQRQAVYWGLDDQFRELFVNSETRATDQISDSTLIEWTRAMQGNTPNISSETANKAMDDALDFQFYTDSLQGLIDRYNRDKKHYFPGIDQIEQGFFNAPSQDTYKALHPELQRYWDWKESIGATNPQLGSYLSEHSAHNKVRNGTYSNITDAIYSQFANNKGVISNLQNAEYYGFKLQPWVENKLKIAYANLGITSPSYEKWLQSLYDDVEKFGKIMK